MEKQNEIDRIRNRMESEISILKEKLKKKTKELEEFDLLLEGKKYD